MKRAGSLYDLICDPDNLRLAWVKAKKGKEGKHDVFLYGKFLNANLDKLRSQLLNETAETGRYHFFTIYEPKERTICAAAFHERVLHHAIMNVCHPVFERFQVHHSYATRQGKGQYSALEYAKTNQRKYRWFCKLDIRKYFDSISHEILHQQIECLFKDQRLLNLFRRIITSYEASHGKGLPIGNLTSQYFANYYLAIADHYLLEKIKVPAYARYMDDMVIWHDDKYELIKIQKQFTRYIQDTLGLIMKPPCINKNEKGLPFLGYVVFPGHIRLNKQSKQRFIRKLSFADSNLNSGKWTQAVYANHVIPLLAFTKHANSHQLRKRMCENI